MSQIVYSYALLRYYHDVVAGEFINIGVAVFCRGEVWFKVRPSLGKFGDLLETDLASNARSLLKYLKARTDEVSLNSRSIDPKLYGSLKQALLDVMPSDDSTLQWSEPKDGLTKDIEATLGRLYARYCGKYDRKIPSKGRTDDEVLKDFRLKLATRNMLSYFSEKSIVSDTDEVKFPFAWKNGIWHCIETISLDLAKADSVRDKAHKCAGEIVGIRDAIEPFAVYYVVSPPKRPGLQDAFTKALKILQKIPHEAIEVYEEGREGPLLDKLTAQIGHHPLL
jgi:Protein of unknown function (DUF3037).